MTEWVLTQEGDWRPGTVHEVRSRNLSVAAYAGEGRWIGIREKFDSRFLFSEHSPPGVLGTVRLIGRVLGVVPEEIRLTEWVGAPYCQLCGTTAVWTPDEPGARRGSWSCAEGCIEVRPAQIENRPLFELLEDLQEELESEQVTDL